jgi:hypothetical protein
MSRGSGGDRIGQSLEFRFLDIARPSNTCVDGVIDHGDFDLLALGTSQLHRQHLAEQGYEGNRVFGIERLQGSCP